MVSEQLLNLKFVLEVEKYPCLYNYKVPEYVRKDMVDKAWSEIGKTFKMSGAECKEKWRNIRNVFVRKLKRDKQGCHERKKPYYLNEVMQFTVPYIRWSRVIFDGKPVHSIDMQTINTVDSDEEEDGQNATDSNPQYTDFQLTGDLYNEHAASPSYLEPIRSPQPQTSVPAHLQSRPEPAQSPQSPHSLMSPSPSDFSTSLFKEKSRRTKSCLDDGFNEYLKTKQARMEKSQDLEQQPKKMFILSLLPDLESMSDRQMRKFKIRVMQLIEEILDERASPVPAQAFANNSGVPEYYETRVKIEEADNDGIILD